MTVAAERHGPCPFNGDRCAFCGFLWSGHPTSIRINPDRLVASP